MNILEMLLVDINAFLVAPSVYLCSSAHIWRLSTLQGVCD